MKLINQLLRGMVIGIANLIPGVSGGTMMVSMGIYDTLIDGITHIIVAFKRSIKTLLPYIAGMAIGGFALSGLLSFCLTNYPLPTSTAFIGLILGGIATLTQRIDKRPLSAVSVLLMVGFFVLVVVLALTDPAALDATIHINAGEILVLVVLGAIAGGTMLVPGVSGAMMLLLLGYYRPVVNALDGVRDGLLSANLALVWQQVPVLLPYALGGLVGLLLVANLMDWLLKRWHTHTYCAVLGLVIASPIAILLRTDLSGLSVWMILASVLTFVAGFAVAAWLANGDARGKHSTNRA